MLFPFKSSGLAPLLSELDRWRDKLDLRSTLPRSWTGRLRRDLEAEAVAASTAMEGVAVTVDEVRRILAGDKLHEVAEEDQDLVRGYRDAMGFVLRRADDAGFRWSRELIVALHDRILAGKHALEAGRFRTTRSRLVDASTGAEVFLPPRAEEVGSLVDEACDRLERVREHPALAAAWIHVAVAAIHPFRDGNGRSCRVLASLAMHRGGFKRREFTSLEEWWGRHRASYYAAFRCLGKRFSRTSDVSPFVRLHLQAQLSQVRALDLREEIERRIWTVVEDLALERRMDRRIANALWDAFFGRDVTAGYFRSLTDVSPATATQDLALASAAGLLLPEGQRKGRVYRAGRVLVQEVARAVGVELDGQEPLDSARGRIVHSLGDRLAVRAPHRRRSSAPSR